MSRNLSDDAGVVRLSSTIETRPVCDEYSDASPRPSSSSHRSRDVESRDTEPTSGSLKCANRRRHAEAEMEPPPPSSSSRAEAASSGEESAGWRARSTTLTLMRWPGRCVAIVHGRAGVPHRRRAASAAAAGAPGSTGAGAAS